MRDAFVLICDAVWMLVLACVGLCSAFLFFMFLYQSSDRVTNIKRQWGDQPSLAASYDQANSSTVNTGY